MNDRLNWMFPSISMGRLFSTDIRVSWWFILVPVITGLKYGIELGLAFMVLMFVSVLLHEFGHVIAARWTGGYADEIHMTPIGGLALARPAQGAFGLGVTSAAGPAVNLVLCIASYPGWYAPETLWGSLNPCVMPIARLSSAHLWRDLGLLLFTANWIGLLVNLLPVLPLDGGQILRAILAARTYAETVQRTAIRVGMFVSVAFLAVGAIADISQIVLIGTFVLAMNLVQLLQDEYSESMGDSGFGHDFSGGYESLERSGQAAGREHSPGLLEQWRERRRMERENLDRIRRKEAEEQLDLLLAKVHENGLQSLSAREQKLLKSCSELLRPKSKSEG